MDNKVIICKGIHINADSKLENVFWSWDVSFLNISEIVSTHFNHEKWKETGKYNHRFPNESDLCLFSTQPIGWDCINFLFRLISSPKDWRQSPFHHFNTFQNRIWRKGKRLFDKLVNLNVWLMWYFWKIFYSFTQKTYCRTLDLVLRMKFRLEVVFFSAITHRSCFQKVLVKSLITGGNQRECTT